jgi:hypothetical protein
VLFKQRFMLVGGETVPSSCALTRAREVKVGNSKGKLYFRLAAEEHCVIKEISGVHTCINSVKRGSLIWLNRRTRVSSPSFKFGRLCKIVSKKLSPWLVLLLEDENSRKTITRPVKYSPHVRNSFDMKRYTGCDDFTPASVASNLRTVVALC